jgi:flagellar hook-length control protein FliK
VVLKTTVLMAPVTTQAKTAASGAAAANASASASSATPSDPAAGAVIQQPAAATKSPVGADSADAALASAPASPSSVGHDHAPAIATAAVLSDPSNIGAQATMQQQLPPATAIAVPLGPLSVTAATNAPVPLSGLALEIAASVQNGRSRFEIRLDPADLGRIDVRVDVDRNGQVTSHLTVEKPETLSMLRQDAPQLQRALDDAGLKTGNGGLQFSLRDQSSSGQNNDTSSKAQQLVISDEDTVPAALAGQTYGRMLGSSSGVDIRV